MTTFYKTELGLRTLKLRDLPLNARQRRLLVLIGTEDFNTLNHSLKQRIAEPELLQQLIDLGLVFKQKTDTPAEINLIKTAPETTSTRFNPISEINIPLQKSVVVIDQNYVVEPEKTHTEFKDEQPHIQFKALPFEDLKLFMIQYLQQYCGLIAKQLILKINQSEHISQLKQCQMQWITQLQESRILPKVLNDALQQINLSIRTLQTS